MYACSTTTIFTLFPDEGTICISLIIFIISVLYNYTHTYLYLYKTEQCNKHCDTNTEHTFSNLTKNSISVSPPVASHSLQCRPIQTIFQLPPPPPHAPLPWVPSILTSKNTYPYINTVSNNVRLSEIRPL